MATPMRLWFNSHLREIAPRYTGSVINVGSGDDADNEGGHYRDYFIHPSNYITCDPFCDNADIHLFGGEILDQVGQFDIVLNFWTLEHIWDVKHFIFQLARITRGILIIAVPTKYPYHAAPNDYWRFTEEAMRRLLLGNFEITDLKQFDDHADMGGILIIAKKMR